MQREGRSMNLLLIGGSAGDSASPFCLQCSLSGVTCFDFAQTLRVHIQRKRAHSPLQTYRLQERGSMALMMWGSICQVCWVELFFFPLPALPGSNRTRMEMKATKSWSADDHSSHGLPTCRVQLWARYPHPSPHLSHGHPLTQSSQPPCQADPVLSFLLRMREST